MAKPKLKSNLKSNLPGCTRKSNLAGCTRAKFLVGIDEAGRGPLAGPVSVSAVVISMKEKEATLKAFNEAKDSKQMTALSRETLFKKIKERKKEGGLDYSVALVSAKIIDTKGIVFAIRLAIKRILKKLAVPPHQTLVLLDGSLKAPEHFLFQETIIRGDHSEKIISLASVAAKVTRDQKMMQLSKKYPEYGFEIHKGYGTLFHREKIKKYGPSEVHRKSFLMGILNKSDASPQ